MLNTLESRKVTVYSSEIRPKIETEDVEMAKVIAWADDEHPIAWDIVMSRKSRAFGIGSCVHVGWAQQGDSSEAVLERLCILRYYATYEPLPPPALPKNKRSQTKVLGRGRIWQQRPIIQHVSALFTLEHFEDPSFTGGFFRQHATWTDGESYSRSCIHLDYTLNTLEKVLDVFASWMDPYYEKTTHITIDNVTKRIFPELKKISKTRVKKNRGQRATKHDRHGLASRAARKR